MSTAIVSPQNTALLSADPTAARTTLATTAPQVTIGAAPMDPPPPVAPADRTILALTVAVAEAKADYAEQGESQRSECHMKPGDDRRDGVGGGWPGKSATPTASKPATKLIRLSARLRRPRDTRAGRNRWPKGCRRTSCAYRSGNNR